MYWMGKDPLPLKQGDGEDSGLAAAGDDKQDKCGKLLGSACVSDADCAWYSKDGKTACYFADNTTDDITPY